MIVWLDRRARSAARDRLARERAHGDLADGAEQLRELTTSAECV